MQLVSELVVEFSGSMSVQDFMFTGIFVPNFL